MCNHEFTDSTWVRKLFYWFDFKPRYLSAITVASIDFVSPVTMTNEYILRSPFGASSSALTPGSPASLIKSLVGVSESHYKSIFCKKDNYSSGPSRQYLVVISLITILRYEK